jgi:phosphoglycerate dehydrogenase-like enzyme
MIVLLESVHPDAMTMLERADEVRLMADPLTYDDDLDRQGVRVILTRGRGRISAATYDEFPDLVVVGRCGAGLDNIDVETATSRGIAVVHAPGATTAAVSEHAVLLMLGLARHVTRLDAAVKDGRWSVRDAYIGTEMRGKRLGVVGLGAIGRRVAELGRALDMDVVFWSPSSRDDVLEWCELDDTLATSDVVQLCIALTPATRHLIDERRLGLMLPAALLVNTSRGAVVDQAALRSALVAGRIGGYAADVWDPEPPPAGDFAEIRDRLLVTPHVAAITDVTYRDICVRTAAAAIAALGSLA